MAPMTAEECRQLIDIAVQQINTGNVDAADSILSKVIDSLGRQSGHAERLQLMSAYVARGTARWVGSCHIHISVVHQHVQHWCLFDSTNPLLQP